MRKGFTLVECMVAGAILVLVVTAFMQALAVINRVEHENAQYMEADAIVWDAIAESFNRKFEEIDRATIERETTVCEFPARLFVSFDGSNIVSWIEWNNQVLSNEVMRSACARKRES